jgi:L-asparaginase
MQTMTAHCRIPFAIAAIVALIVAAPLAQDRENAKPRIAVFSGPNATIQNNKPLVTSNKAREDHGLPLRRDASGRPLMDSPRYQRLAAPVTV